MASWFVSGMPRAEVREMAQDMLQHGRPGNFLVRDVKSERNCYGLVVLSRERKLVNFHIEKGKRGYTIRGTEQTFPSLALLIQHYSTKKRPQLGIRLIPLAPDANFGGADGEDGAYDYGSRAGRRGGSRKKRLSDQERWALNAQREKREFQKSLGRATGRQKQRGAPPTDYFFRADASAVDGDDDEDNVLNMFSGSKHSDPHARGRSAGPAQPQAGGSRRSRGANNSRKQPALASASAVQSSFSRKQQSSNRSNRSSQRKQRGPTAPGGAGGAGRVWGARSNEASLDRPSSRARGNNSSFRQRARRASETSDSFAVADNPLLQQQQQHLQQQHLQQYSNVGGASWHATPAHATAMPHHQALFGLQAGAREPSAQMQLLQLQRLQQQQQQQQQQVQSPASATSAPSAASIQ